VVALHLKDERAGVEFVRDVDTMAGEAGIESEVVFDGLRAPTETLVGERKEGFRDGMEALDRGRVNTPAQGLGLSQGASETAQEFTADREQLDRPVRTFQGGEIRAGRQAYEERGRRLLVAPELYRWPD
jgi:alkylation response protein AidB-like acyl-CoA dehydrogenase